MKTIKHEAHLVITEEAFVAVVVGVFGVVLVHSSFLQKKRKKDKTEIGRTLEKVQLK